MRPGKRAGAGGGIYGDWWFDWLFAARKVQMRGGLREWHFAVGGAALGLLVGIGLALVDLRPSSRGCRHGQATRGCLVDRSRLHRRIFVSGRLHRVRHVLTRLFGGGDIDPSEARGEKT